MLVIDNRPVEVEFAFQAPQAEEVLLTGDFNHWRSHDLRLRKDAAGFWRVDVWLAPGSYEYGFIVDGQWQKDPRATAWVANDFGYSNGVLQIG